MGTGISFLFFEEAHFFRLYRKKKLMVDFFFLFFLYFAQLVEELVPGRGLSVQKVADQRQEERSKKPRTQTRDKPIELTRKRKGKKKTKKTKQPVRY